MRVRTYIYGVMALLASVVMTARAEEQPYLCELGLQAGVGYYVGDAAPHIFWPSSIQATAGIHFRYKFTKRWALQVKASGQRITGDSILVSTGGKEAWNNHIYNMDVMAEFNFFRFGATNEYDKRIKPYTPYIFLGVGCGLYKGIDGAMTAAAYIPFGIGFKWKFYDCLGLNIAWQHNIYIADNIEGVKELDNTYNLNGSNIMNCDLTGQLTVGLVVEFGRAKRPCRICNY